MRQLPVELDDETVDALEVERQLIGFESRAAYVQWIIDHRAAIDQGVEHGPLLESYRRRVADLEARLERDGEGEREGVSEDADCSAVTALRGDPGGWTRAKSDPTVQVRGSPRTTVRPAQDGEDATAGSPKDAATVDDDSDTGTDDSVTADDAVEDPPADDDAMEDPPADDSVEEPPPEVDSMRLTPERVTRIREDPILEDAGSLGSVELDRLDELSRRAVAKTRKRLDREVHTGLEYASSTRLAGEGVRPGEDIVDLESLSLPGRSAEALERRREAAGRAIAYLRDERRARKSDFLEALYEECPAGYDTADSWWECIKAALKQVETVEGGDGSRVWTYAGEL